MPDHAAGSGPARATLDKRRGDVAAMFDRVAARYDLANDVLSLGQDRAWRKLVVEAVAPRPGQLILDLAAGTGTSSEPFAHAGAIVVPTDLSLGMLQVGKAAQARPELRCRRRAAAAVRRRQLRCGHHLLRAAQRRGHRGRTRRDAPGDQAGRHPGGVRVLDADLAAVPGGLRELPGRRHPQDRLAGLVQSGGVRVSGRVHPGLARPAGPGRPDRCGRLAAGRVAQPFRRHRRPAPSAGIRRDRPRPAGRRRRRRPRSCWARTRRAAARSRRRTRSIPPSTCRGPSPATLWPSCSRAARTSRRWCSRS